MLVGSCYLTIRCAIRFNDPTGFITESFENFIVVAVFGKLVVTVHSQTGEDLRSYGSSSSLSPFVILSLLPRWLSRPRRHFRRRKNTRRRWRKKKETPVTEITIRSSIKHKHETVKKFLDRIIKKRWRLTKNDGVWRSWIQFIKKFSKEEFRFDRFWLWSNLI